MKTESLAAFRFSSYSFGGGTRDRTADLLHAMQALSQLSYTPNRARNYTDPPANMQSRRHPAAAWRSRASTTSLRSAATIASMALVCVLRVSATRSGIITSGIL
jgi:hypothetical protein